MKRLFILSLCLLLSRGSLAQLTVYGRVSIGASRVVSVQPTGYNNLLIADFGGQVVQLPSTNNQVLLTGSIGGGIKLPVTHSYYIQAELNVDQKGYTQRIERVQQGIYCDPAACFVYPAEGRYSVRLTYLNLPVLLGYQLNKRVALAVGPYLGYLLSNEQKGTYTYLNGRSNSIPLDDHYKKVDVGVAAEVVYRLTEGLAVDLRYTHGLQPSTKPYRYQSPYLGYAEDIDQRLVNQTAQLAVRYNWLR